MDQAHFHHCPSCYEAVPCEMNCTICPDLSEGYNEETDSYKRAFGVHEICKTCETRIARRKALGLFKAVKPPTAGELACIVIRTVGDLLESDWRHDQDVLQAGLDRAALIAKVNELQTYYWQHVSECLWLGSMRTVQAAFDIAADDLRIAKSEADGLRQKLAQAEKERDEAQREARRWKDRDACSRALFQDSAEKERLLRELIYCTCGHPLSKHWTPGTQAEADQCTECSCKDVQRVGPKAALERLDFLLRNLTRHDIEHEWMAENPEGDYLYRPDVMLAIETMCEGYGFNRADKDGGLRRFITNPITIEPPRAGGLIMRTPSVSTVTREMCIGWFGEKAGESIWGDFDRVREQPITMVHIPIAQGGVFQPAPSQRELARTENPAQMHVLLLEYRPAQDYAPDYPWIIAKETGGTYAGERAIDLGSLVHLMLNVTDEELHAIGSRLRTADGKTTGPTPKEAERNHCPHQAVGGAPWCNACQQLAAKFREDFPPRPLMRVCDLWVRSDGAEVKFAFTEDGRVFYEKLTGLPIKKQIPDTKTTIRFRPKDREWEDVERDAAAYLGRQDGAAGAERMTSDQLARKLGNPTPGVATGQTYVDAYQKAYTEAVQDETHFCDRCDGFVQHCAGIPVEKRVRIARQIRNQRKAELLASQAVTSLYDHEEEMLENAEQVLAEVEAELKESQALQKPNPCPVCKGLVQHGEVFDGAEVTCTSCGALLFAVVAEEGTAPSWDMREPPKKQMRCILLSIDLSQVPVVTKEQLIQWFGQPDADAVWQEMEANRKQEPAIYVVPLQTITDPPAVAPKLELQPSVIDFISKARPDGDGPFDALISMGDIYDEEGRRILGRDELFIFERKARPDGFKPRVKIHHIDDAGGLCQSFVLDEHKARILGQMKPGDSIFTVRARFARGLRLKLSSARPCTDRPFDVLRAPEGGLRGPDGKTVCLPAGEDFSVQWITSDGKAKICDADGAASICFADPKQYAILVGESGDSTEP